LWTICPGWPWALILAISAPQVARITGVSHWYPAFIPFLNVAYIQWVIQVGCKGEAIFDSMWDSSGYLVQFWSFLPSGGRGPKIIWSYRAFVEAWLLPSGTCFLLPLTGGK
jgi:hypothetical protein